MTSDIPWQIIKHRKVWFLNGDLVSIHHRNKAVGYVTLKNYTKDRLETMMLKDFRRFRKRAFTITEAAELLNRDPVYLARKAKRGWWPMAVGREPNGLQKWTGPAYYSEDHLYEMRELMAQVHRGRPRKDGFVTNNTTPSEAELRAAINKKLFVYVKTEDGTYEPIFDPFDSG